MTIKELNNLARRRQKNGDRMGYEALIKHIWKVIEAESRVAK